MLEHPLFLVGLFRAVLCSRADLVAENLLLRQWLTVLSRPTRNRSRFRTGDKLFWVLTRGARIFLLACLLEAHSAVSEPVREELSRPKSALMGGRKQPRPRP